MRRQRIAWILSLTLALALVAGALAAAPGPSATKPALYLPVVMTTGGSVPTGDLLVQGRVHERLAGPLAGIESATVWLTSCVDGWTTQTNTLADGSYVLIMPAAYVDPCDTLILGARADGFRENSAELSVDELRAQPRRDIGLVEQDPTPTPTTEPIDDLTIYGTVTRCGVISGGEIGSAVVSAEACTVLNRSETLTDASGAYTITLPASFLTDCNTIYLHASAIGYQTQNYTLTVDELRQYPNRELCLNPAVTMPPP